jgi:hypothetical protein
VIHGIQRIHIDAESDEKGSPHFCLASKLLLPTKCLLVQNHLLFSVVGIGKKALDLIQQQVLPLVQQSKEKMPSGEYFKYAEFIRSHITRTVFAIGVAQFLVDGTFVTIETIASLLQSKCKNKLILLQNSKNCAKKHVLSMLISSYFGAPRGKHSLSRMGTIFRRNDRRWTRTRPTRKELRNFG